MLCVECGKELPIFRGGVCLNCYLKHTQFSKGPVILDITLCPRCSSYKYKNTWMQESFHDILKRHIKDVFSISPELKNVEIQTKCNEQDRVLLCMVFISGFLEGHQITEQHSLTIRIRHTTCNICSKETGGYYEAIIQIRAEKRTFTDAELQTLRSIVESLVRQHQESGKRGLFITDIDIRRNGLDFFLSEKTTAFSIVKKLQEQFGGNFKQSASTVGMKDSREVYRMTYLIRIPAYRKGDFFSYDNSFFMIISLHQNKVRCLELSSWTEKVIEGKEILPSKILGGKELIKEMIMVSQSKNEVQLMDPKSYTIVEICKPTASIINTQMIKTVKLDDYIFLVPE
jgi:nonsense-mediated mRNA decay protein 3